MDYFDTTGNTYNEAQYDYDIFDNCKFKANANEPKHYTLRIIIDPDDKVINLKNFKVSMEKTQNYFFSELYEFVQSEFIKIGINI